MHAGARLERGDDGRYRIGLRMWELGALAPRGLGLREAALPFMEDLYEVTHENVQLAVRDDDRGGVRRAVRRPATPWPVCTQVGGRFALPPTGVGLVLLAHAPVDVQERVLAAPLKRLHPAHGHRPAPAAPDPGRRAPHRGRHQRPPGDHRRGVGRRADRGARDTVVAALSIVVRGSSAAAVRAMTPGVRAAARGISRTLDGPSVR